MNSIYRSNNDALIRLAKKTIENNKTEFDAYIKNLIASKGAQADNELFSELSNIDWIFLNSIFLALYSNFENLIYKLARIVENQNSGQIGIEDIRGQGYIDQYRKYMHLVGKIESAKKDEMWDELDIYRLVRNKLTHEGGYFNKSLKSKLEDKKGFKYLIDNKVLLAGTFGHIRLRETFFLEKFCGLTNKLLDRLLKDIGVSE
ncbi:hypothetical protein [Fulvivirga lutea]|uniref:Uncharacterized protein n=1 Tax=Fulvivirga lutea TaxID=2810512 RepID=A0A975A0I8_9BACT|nr:hypothetical protein [Fulvivirga lutea]QSE97240.1 hypothetical protein JR347_16860 [Fulvivirga lutea]